MHNIIANWLIIILSIGLLNGSSINQNSIGKHESVCLMAKSSTKEAIILGYVFYDGAPFQLRSEKHSGCLLLHDIFMFDTNGDGIKDRDIKWAQFINDDENHCCTGGG